MSEQNLEALKNGDFSKITQIIIDAKDNDSLLLQAAQIISEKINVSNWKDNADEILAIFEAGFDNNEIFKAFW